MFLKYSRFNTKMVLENFLDSENIDMRSLKRSSRFISATLALSSLLMSSSPSYAIIDGSGNIDPVAGGGVFCVYKEHRLQIRYEIINNERRWFASKAYDSKWREVDVRALNPTPLIEYDPNTGICQDIEEHGEFLCC